MFDDVLDGSNTEKTDFHFWGAILDFPKCLTHDFESKLESFSLIVFFSK